MRFSLWWGVGYRRWLSNPSTKAHNDDLCECNSSQINFPERIICESSTEKSLKVSRTENFSDSSSTGFRRNRKRWHWIECCFGKNRYKAVWKLFSRSHYGIVATWLRYSLDFCLTKLDWLLMFSDYLAVIRLARLFWFVITRPKSRF